MKNKPLLIALGVFAVLLGAYFLTRQPQVSAGVKALEWPQLTAEQVQAIDIGGAHRARLERGADGWTVASPDAPQLKYRADEGLVRALVDALVALKAPSLVSERSAKHAEYEVDAAKGTQVTVQTTDGRRHELILGKAGRSGGTYVRRGGSDAVFLSTVALGWQAQKDVSAWRDKTLPTVAASEVARVIVTHPDGHRYTLAAGEDGAWSLVSEAPRGFRFDPSAAQRLVGQLTALRAQDFVSGDAPDFSQAVTLTLERKAGAPLTVSIAAKRPDGTWPVSVEGRAEVALLPGWTGEQLVKRLDDLRDTSLFSFDVAQATKLAIDVDGKRTMVEKRGDTWHLVEPKAAPAGVTFDGGQVPAVLARLRGLKAARLAADAAAKATGLAKPTGQVVVTLEGGATQRLVLGADGPDGTVYARGAADELTWLLPGYERTSLARGVELFAPPPPPPNFGGGGLDQLPPEIRRQLEAQLKLTH
jgi:hypothetical protein